MVPINAVDKKTEIRQVLVHEDTLEFLGVVVILLFVE
jgi:hypothetical protein